MKRDNIVKRTSSRMILVGICAWISVCLLIAGWLPEANSTISAVWLISGLMGLVSAVGLAETIKADMQMQEHLLKRYMEAALTDGLTGLANRQSLDQMLEDILNDPKARQQPLSLVMIDIDHFKAFNDRWGHQAGDAVLRCVTRHMAEFFQNKGFAARYGGEEFAVVLANCRLVEADRLAEQYRLAAKETTCEYREKALRITVSCGVTEAVAEDTAESLLQRADLALYTAKKMGRDCIWVTMPNAKDAPASSISKLNIELPAPAGQQG